MPPKAKRSRKTKKTPNQAEQQGKRERTAPNKPIERRTLTPRFKAIFSAVVFITVLSLVGYTTLALIAGINSIDSPVVNGAIETLKTAFISGFGAILGLLGGKAL